MPVTWRLLKRFTGLTYEQVNGEGATLTPITATAIEAAYQNILDVYKIRFVGQIAFSQSINGVSFDDIEGNAIHEICDRI